MVSLTSSLFFSNIHSLCDVLNKLFLPAINTHLIWLLVRVSVLTASSPSRWQPPGQQGQSVLLTFVSFSAHPKFVVGAQNQWLKE